MALTAVAFCTQISLAQNNQDLAKQKGKEAIKLEDEGKFDEALKLLDEAQKLDPDNIAYPYEATYAYYSQKKYDKVITVLEKLKDRPDTFDRLYQLLGNSYDMVQKQDKAIAVYEEGLKKFPNSGCLYLERGVIPLVKKEYNEALKFFEKGIDAEPGFPSNYFWAAKLYCGSENEMWGMIYGEIFMNLERNSQRTSEISKLLYDTYRSEIKFPSPDKATVSFNKQMTMQVDDIKNNKLPYGMVYEAMLSIGIVGEKEINLASLNNIRANFLKAYNKNNFEKKYPNVLFEYQNKVQAAGHLEAYNYWILMKGDEPAFTVWQQANKSKWDAFAQWFMSNGLQADAEHYFSRLKM